ncbi:HEPN domain-containing protein [Rhodococcus sp. LB1]|uniref:ApeA N-terminal domain 1-containing protein n=1 Tax=Rhodococcus sp. LB1 TaxID=1807499 RepID=UPI0012E986DA|nr:HEPN domain-containing protein [Rhodococcus sp. LB1]
MDELIEDSLAGTMASIWPNFESTRLGEDFVPGYVRLENDVLAVHALKPRNATLRDWNNVQQLPEAIVAATEQSGSIFFDVVGVRDKDIVGATRASTRHYRTRGAVVGFRVDELRSIKIRRMTAYFPGLTRWSGMSGATHRHEVGADGRPTSWSTTVRAAPDREAKLSAGRKLVISTHWSVTGADDDRRIFTPFSVSSMSAKPLPWHDHLWPLTTIQDLVSLAYEGFVTADGGVAELDLTNTATPRTTPKLWSSQLMQCPAGVDTPNSMNEIPMFYLENIGGINGLKRWVTLTELHGRAVGPLTSRYRIGSGAAVESRLNDVAVGIEYWVNYHKKQKTAWATPNRNKDFQPERLARHVGKPFTDFVGDPVRWAKLFWDRYGDLKHASSLQYDGYEIHLLAESGLILLACALLNRIAGSKNPSRMICEGHRNHNLGLEMRRMLGAE